MKSFSLAILASLVGTIVAHPGGHAPLSAREAETQLAAAHKRHLTARNCATQASAFHAKRKLERRAMMAAKRAVANNGRAFGVNLAERQQQEASGTVTAEEPHYSTIQNWTCVTAPETVEGPYYINNEMVRNDLTEDQPGVNLVIDVGLLDINTCEPIPNAFVELWAANATGVYGGYPAQLGGGGGAPPEEGEPSATSSMPVPSGGPPPGGPGGSMPVVRNETWLRGGESTNENGVVELTTIYPGFYAGRTAHVHTMIHLDYETSENGTLVSHAGSLLHIGQFFFEESWNDAVYTVSPYTENTNPRTLNSEDGILEEANTGGNSAFLDLELLGESVEDGVLGYITVGVDVNAAYDINNGNYLNSTGPSVASGYDDL